MHRNDARRSSRMRRRDLAAALGAALGAIMLVRATRAAGAGKVVGLLAPAPLRPIDSFKAELRRRGWTEGQNIRFEPRWAGGDDTRYDALAAELAALPADAILTWGTPAVLAANGRPRRSRSSWVRSATRSASARLPTCRVPAAM